MSGKRAKIAATATVLGLGALGGVALESNHGLPAQTAQVRSGSGAVVTTASGAVAPATQTVVSGEAATTRAPIVTRASGVGAGGIQIDD
jgi:hypothetical protein